MKLAHALTCDDGGFSLVEAVVAALMVTTAFVGTFTALDAASKSSSRLGHSNVAYNIAADEIDRLRHLGDTDVNGLMAQNNAVSTRVVNGVTYTITDRAYYTEGVGSTPIDACANPSSTASSGGAPYIYISADVDYGGRYNSSAAGATAAIGAAHESTYFATEGGNLQTATGSIRAYVNGPINPPTYPDGPPLLGRSVSLYNVKTGALVSTKTTNATGCVMFTGLAAGTYQLKVATTANEVDLNLNSNPALSDQIPLATRGTAKRIINISTPVTVRLSNGSSYFYYTKSSSGGANIALNPTTVNTGANTSSILLGPVVLQQATYLNQTSPYGYRFYPYQSTVPLYPYSGGVNMWAGSCVDNNPDDGNAGNGLEDVVLPSPANNSSWAAGQTYSPDPSFYLPSLRVRGNDQNGTAASNAEVQVDLNASTCGSYPSAGATNWVRLPGTTSASGLLADVAYALPKGSYNICVRRVNTYTIYFFGIPISTYNETDYGLSNGVTNAWAGPTSVTNIKTNTTSSCGDSSLW